MKRFATLTAALLVGVTAWVVLAQPGETGAPAQTTRSLPPSLDKLYPPVEKGPMFLVAMVQLGTSLSGMATDVMEGDFAHAELGYTDFRAQYEKVSKMVPEWADAYPMEPVDALGEAVKGHDPAKIMPAVEQASKTCHTCHVQSMTGVQQKYHWGDFRSIVVSDPVSKSDVPFAVFMQMLDGDLAGAQVDLAQGQVDAARAHATALAARYDTLGDTCGACHDSDRYYYVDSRITGMIQNLGASMTGTTVDADGIQKLVQGIGMESCHKCHLVHGPAAMATHARESGES